MAQKYGTGIGVYGSGSGSGGGGGGTVNNYIITNNAYGTVTAFVGGFTNGTIGAALATAKIWPVYGGSPVDTSDNGSVTVPLQPGTYTNFQVLITSAPGTATNVFYILTNGISTGLVVTNNGTSIGSFTALSQAQVSLQITNWGASAITGVSAYWSCGMQVPTAVASVNGTFNGGNAANSTNLNGVAASNYVNGTFQSLQIMGACTNPIIYLNSNITVAVFGQPFNGTFSPSIYKGVYTNISPLGSGFVVWHQTGGTNFLTQNNPQWNSDDSSTYCLTLGIQTNNDSDGNLIGADNTGAGFITSGELNASNAFQIPCYWGNVSVIDGGIPNPVILTYGVQNINVFEPSNAASLINPHNFYVSAKTGSDFNDGRSLGTPWLTFQTAAFYATNYGDVINIASGFYFGATISSGVSLFGTSENTNGTVLQGIGGGGGDETIANLRVFGMPEMVVTNNQTMIVHDVYNIGNEPFSSLITGQGNGKVLIYDDFFGNGLQIFQGSNIFISNCTFFPGYNYGPPTTAVTSQINLQGASTFVNVSDCHFIAATNAVYPLNFLIGEQAGTAGNLILGAGNDFDMRNAPAGCNAITNAIVVNLQYALGASNMPQNGAVLIWTNGTSQWVMPVSGLLP